MSSVANNSSDHEFNNNNNNDEDSPELSNYDDDDEEEESPEEEEGELTEADRRCGLLHAAVIRNDAAGVSVRQALQNGANVVNCVCDDNDD